jgi:hypothetical protein
MTRVEGQDRQTEAQLQDFIYREFGVSDRNVTPFWGKRSVRRRRGNLGMLHSYD